MGELSVGKKVGRYTLLRKVSRGVLGPCWLLEFQHEQQKTLALGRVVTLLADNEEVADVINEVAWDALEVEHDYIMHAGEVVFADGHLVTVYDYVEGQPLSNLGLYAGHETPAFAPGVALRMVSDMLEGLEGLHEAGARLESELIYGGFTPEAVLVTTAGRCLLMDPLVGAAVTRWGEALRDPRYLAPEIEAAPADAVSDVYAAGCILSELLTNRRRSGSGDSKALAKPNAALTPALRAVVTRSTERDPRQRFRTARQMSEALHAAGERLAERAEVASFLEQLAKTSLKGQRAATENSVVARIADLVAATRHVRGSRQESEEPTPRISPSPDKRAATGRVPRPARAKQERVVPPPRALQLNRSPTLLGIPTPITAPVLAAPVASTAKSVEPRRSSVLLADDLPAPVNKPSARVQSDSAEPASEQDSGERVSVQERPPADTVVLENQTQTVEAPAGQVQEAPQSEQLQQAPSLVARLALEWRQMATGFCLGVAATLAVTFQFASPVPAEPGSLLAAPEPRGPAPLNTVFLVESMASACAKQVKWVEREPTPAAAEVSATVAPAMPVQPGEGGGVSVAPPASAATQPAAKSRRRRSSSKPLKRAKKPSTFIPLEL